jgi:hypothetical protein
MLHTQRPRGVRLGVDFEASALMATLGPEAYSAACLRAQEASSDEMAQDWTEVADVIARRMRRRAFGVLTSMLH